MICFFFFFLVCCVWRGCQSSVHAVHEINVCCCGCFDRKDLACNAFLPLLFSLLFFFSSLFLIVLVISDLMALVRHLLSLAECWVKDALWLWFLTQRTFLSHLFLLSRLDGNLTQYIFNSLFLSSALFLPGAGLRQLVGHWHKVS